MSRWQSRCGNLCCLQHPASNPAFQAIANARGSATSCSMKSYSSLPDLCTGIGAIPPALQHCQLHLFPVNPATCLCQAAPHATGLLPRHLKGQWAVIHQRCRALFFLHGIDT